MKLGVDKFWTILKLPRRTTGYIKVKQARKFSQERKVISTPTIFDGELSKKAWKWRN